MLPVQIHQQPANLSQNSRGYRRSVDPGATATTHRNLALQHESLVFDFYSTLIGELYDALEVGDVEHALDRGFVRAGADQVSARPLAEEQTQRADDDGFTGARLAREHIEAFRQRKVYLFNDCEIAYAQLCEHCLYSPSGTPPQPSLTLILSKKVVLGKRTIRTGLSARLTLSFSPLTKLVPT